MKDSKIKIYVFAIIAVWTTLLAASFLWNQTQIKKNMLRLAETKTRLAFEKDFLYRQWNNNHGGVYVYATEETPPNPYMDYLPENTITTSAGRLMVLVNPAFMIRQTNELAKKIGSTSFTRVTSLKPVNPANKPDSWEEKALRQIELGKKEVLAIEEMYGKKYMRLMTAFITAKPCIKCHAVHGYKEGDVRGGISSMTYIDDILAIGGRNVRRMLIIHGSLWFLGSFGIIFSTVQIRKSSKRRRKAEEELVKSQKLESIGILAGGIAHDFNNLMTAIYSYIELSRMSVPSQSDAASHLLKAEEACKKAEDLSSRLITFSKGGEPLKNIIPVSALVKETASEAAKGTGSTCKFSIPGDLRNIKADERQIKQVIRNLIINAVEAMPEGGVINITCGNISVTGDNGLSLKNGDYVKISIKDSGAGIPEENLPKIFDPYFSTKDRYSQKGLGLGLAVSYSIVKKHQGLITAESRPGEGATFHVYIPAA